MPVTIRTFAPEDSPAAGRLRGACFPYEITTPDFLAWADRQSPPEERARRMVAEAGGRVVGFGAAKLTLTSAVPGQGLGALMVDPAHRRAGTGTALLAAMEDHLRSVGGRTLRVAGPLPDAEAFAAAGGYTARSTAHFQQLDLAVLPAAPPRPEGVELRPVAHYADDPRPVHAAESEAAQGLPGDLPSAPMPYSAWSATIWSDPRIDRELSALVLVHGEPAGIVAWQSDGRTRLKSAFTGIAPRFRGRRLATYAKTALLHRAHERGFRTACTDNDAGNAPMLAINARLGYRRFVTEALFGRDL
ncbi:GNAT family N-acetyltransferase [Nocardiopsis sediminis]|uniref:GNAT family N-acetyltransferase n=1 Tax=Nocardiopsis sediminis TaxID=1778267 RepID=A0ABV8FIA8_9ACTN